MTYTVLPNSGQSLGVTRAPINTNFSLIQSVFAVNHVGFNNIGAGKHKFVVMPNQSVAPTTLAGEAAIYSKQGSAGVGTSALYMIRDGNAGTEVQLSTSAVGNAQASANGFTWLPGGLLLQWGSFDPNGSINVTFPVVFDSVPFSVLMTQSIDNNSTFRQASISTGTLTSAGFTYEGTVSVHINPVYWIAIGLKI